jgi:hypothetical protein
LQFVLVLARDGKHHFVAIVGLIAALVRADRVLLVDNSQISLVVSEAAFDAAP